MSKFEVYEESVQYHDDDGDVLELVSGTDDGVLLNSDQDGSWVIDKDLPELINHMARLGGVDGHFVEASGHEVETLYKAYACGVGESRVTVNLDPTQPKVQVVEEIARNLWAVAQVMRDEEQCKAELEAKAKELKKALPEVGTYVSLSKGTRTTYGFPVILDEDANIFVTYIRDSLTPSVVVSGMASGRRNVYTVRPDAVTVVRTKAVVGDRVTVTADATTYGGEPSHFGGETVGTIIDIHEFDATVLGYCHTSKDFIEQQVALDFLTPAAEPKIGDRVFVHRDAKTTDTAIGVYFGYAVVGTVLGRGSGMFKGDLHIETTDSRVTVRNRKQYVAPKWVAVLPPEVPEVGDRVLVPKGAKTALGFPVPPSEDTVATVTKGAADGSLGNISVITEDSDTGVHLRLFAVDPENVTVLEKAADIAAARAEVLKNGSVKFEDLPIELKKFVDQEIERKKK